MENNTNPNKKSWNLMIGIALVVFGSFRLYNRLLDENDLSILRIVLTIGFIIYGIYMIYMHFNPPTDNNQ